MPLRLYGLAFILAGIIMLIITVVLWLKYLSFKNCDVTTANVTDVKQTSHHYKGHRRTTYSQILAYTVGGIAYERSLACSSEEYDLGTNRQIKILYKARNPKRIMHYAPADQQRSQKTLWIVTAVLLVIGVVMMLVAK